MQTSKIITGKEDNISSDYYNINKLTLTTNVPIECRGKLIGIRGETINNIKNKFPNTKITFNNKTGNLSITPKNKNAKNINKVLDYISLCLLDNKFVMNFDNSFTQQLFGSSGSYIKIPSQRRA